MFRATPSKNASPDNGRANLKARRLLCELLAVGLCLPAPALASTPTQDERRPEHVRDGGGRVGRPAADGEESVLLKPLALDDPRAKVEAELLNVPPVPDSAHPSSAETMSQEEAGRLREYDVRAGAEVNRAVGSGVPELVREMSEDGGAALPGSGGVNLKQDLSDARAPGGARAESIFGADDRVKVNSLLYPWRAAVKLYILWPSGVWQQSSGVLVNSKYVLTAGQNVYSHSQGGWATYVRAVPGADGSYAPFGQAAATNLRSYAGWVGGASADHNIGLITLSSHIGLSTGWLGLKAYADVVGLNANLAGYSSKGGVEGLYYHWGPIQSAAPFQAFYQIDTAAGQGGSAVYHIEPGTNRYVFAVHTTGGVAANSGCRITPAKFADLAAWIASGF
jgi:glutamyl endopeptidase